MKVKQLNRLAKIVDKGNAILEAISDLEAALNLINKDRKTRVSIAVTNGEDILPISNHVKFSDVVWRELINAEIKNLRKEFKRLRIR